LRILLLLLLTLQKQQRRLWCTGHTNGRVAMFGDTMTATDWWDAGWSAGWAGDDHVRFLAAVSLDLGRPLAGWEQQQVRDGYPAGLRERVEHDADQAARGPVVCEPFADVPW
jgi:hypothetical protein